MKKLLLVLFLTAAVAGLSFAQQNVSAPQKYALVIGNGNYTGIGKLANPVNDANDVTAALQGLGFTVDMVLDANLDQMENAVMRLKNRLSVSKDSYGFLFYAGHGVQSGGENYLIPVWSNIPTENSLRERAVSVQWALAELNNAGNALNVVVLDACRDNPFTWKRSNSRGLTVVANQPADSIIVYATSAGSTAADGTGRNGLFTSHLLNNLKTPGIEVKEIFNRTGADVARASNRTQIPAVYSQFFETAYLGAKPVANVPVQPAPAPTPAPAVQPAPSAAAKSAYDKGNEYYKKGSYTEAIVEFTEAIRLNPQYADAYVYRGLAYVNKKDHDRAIADYNEAIRINPNFAIAYYNRGISYRNKNDYDRAIADYTEAIRINPNYADAYNNRGNAYYNKKDYDRAIADYNEAIRINPKDADTYNNRGSAYYNKKDYDRAISDYEAALRIDPNHALAKTWLENARKAKAGI